MIVASWRGVALGALALLATGCPKDRVPEDAIEELPPWMTHGEEVRLKLAAALLDSGNTLGGLDILRQMRADGYDGPEVDYLQGRALRIDGVTSEAERLLLQARKKMPKDARPSSELCVLYADTERIDEAIDACRQATEADPSEAAAWNNLGFLLLAAEEPQEALESVEKAIELDATQPRYRNNLAMAQAALGRDGQAFQTFQSTMGRADAAYMVGVAVERFQGSEAARVWYDKALDIDPNHAQAKLATGAPPPSEPSPEPTGPEPIGPREEP